MTIFKSSDKIKMYLNNSFGTSNLTQRVKITQGEIQAKRFRAVEARFYFAKKNPSIGFFRPTKPSPNTSQSSFQPLSKPALVYLPPQLDRRQHRLLVPYR